MLQYSVCTLLSILYMWIEERSSRARGLRRYYVVRRLAWMCWVWLFACIPVKQLGVIFWTITGIGMDRNASHDIQYTS